MFEAVSLLLRLGGTCFFGYDGLVSGDGGLERWVELGSCQ